MDLIELKFGMYIIGHHSTYWTKINSYALQSMEANYNKYDSAYTMFSTKPKFDMRIVDHCSSNYINFGVSRIYIYIYIYIYQGLTVILNLGYHSHTRFLQQ